MTKLFLASSFADVSAELLSFEKNLRGKAVTFIPTASKVEKVKFYVESGKQALEEMGILIDEIDISVEVLDVIEERIRKNDFIYVTGGNSFFLLQELKKSGADQIIIEEIRNGKLYIGESAGAIILSQSIQYIEKMDSSELGPELASCEGLDVADFYTLPHYGEAPFSKITKTIEAEFMDTRALYPITNKQVILVEGNEKKIVQSE